MNADELLALARAAAEAGAAVIERGARHVSGARVAFAEKQNAIDLVTEIDRASERAIVEVLKRSGLRIVAEEGTDVAAGTAARSAPSTEGAPVFFVDPLDGTTNFAHGHPFCSVSIGLVAEGVPVLGVVHAPLLGVAWSGGPGLPSVRRDLFRGIERPLAVSSIATLDAALGATGFPYDRRTSTDDNLAAFGALTKATHGVLRCGSAALDLALVADGTYDVYWERKLKPWDLAAGAALVLSAGGKVTDPRGAPFVAEQGGVAATNGLLHRALLDAIAPHLPR